MFTARDIKFEFHAPAPAGALKLDTDARRQVFLIFKEAVNNIVRHANCSRVDIGLATGQGRLILTVSDNGKGIEPAGARVGHGLSNMRRRAEAVGGTLAVSSNGPAGVELTLAVPLERSGRPPWRGFLHT
jgi:signal transduction histidine kinase